VCYDKVNLEEMLKFFPSNGSVKKEFLCTDAAQLGKYHIAHWQTSNTKWRMCVDGFEHFEETTVLFIPNIIVQRILKLFIRKKIESTELNIASASLAFFE